MKKIYIILLLIATSSCTDDNCVDKVCPYNHNACVNCESE